MQPTLTIGAKIIDHGNRGKLHLRYDTWAQSNQCEYVVTKPVNGQHSVPDFIDAIVAAGHSKFDFTTNGRGCTGWVLDQYELFAKEGFIESEFDLKGVMEQEWQGGRATKASKITRGFYMKDTREGGWAGPEEAERYKKPA